MPLTDKIFKALSDQVVQEWTNSTMYLTASSVFETNGWPGFAHWMKIQALEELVHGQWIARYLTGKGKLVDFSSISNPRVAYTESDTSPLAIMKFGLQKEQENTKRIHDLFRLSEDENDAETESFLTRLIDEQTEEEEQFTEAVTRMADADKTALTVLDEEFGDREDTMFEEEFETWEDDGKEASTMEELKFATTDEAIQYLANVTNKKVHVVAAKTFKCPNCGTKVLENTKYCIKCKKKVEKK